jgi:hypothetical protein
MSEAAAEEYGPLLYLPSSPPSAVASTHRDYESQKTAVEKCQSNAVNVENDENLPNIGWMHKYPFLFQPNGVDSTLPTMLTSGLSSQTRLVQSPHQTPCGGQ